MITFEKLQPINIITQLVDLLDYPYFQEHYEIIAIDLSKQQTLDVGPKAIQQINFTGNLGRDRNTFMFSIIEEAKETVLDFSPNRKSIISLFYFNII